MFKSENEKKKKKISKIIYHTLLRASFHKRNQVCQIRVVIYTIILDQYLPDTSNKILG